MLSESSRMSSAAEARFRVQAPNSKPRAIKVVALDVPSEAVVRRLSDASWNQAAFFSASAAADGRLSDLEGGSHSLVAEVDVADLFVMVATPGGDAHAASIIGQACSLKRVPTTALIVDAQSSSDQALAKTLAQIRPWSLMVVIADENEYIEDMLTALRA